jgi:hypothetical protein
MSVKWSRGLSAKVSAEVREKAGKSSEEFSCVVAEKPLESG